MPPAMLTRFLETSLGQQLLRTARPALHYYRRKKQPGLSNNEAVATIQCQGRSFPFRHRRWSDSDRLAMKQCFEQTQYDMPDGAHGVAVQKIYRAILDAGRKPLIIDCGANIGASVLWFATRYPEAHIIAVEPAPDNCDLLRYNSNAFSVDVVQAGISAADGVAYLKNNGQEMAYQITSETTDTTVDLVSIQTLLARAPEICDPFLLKVDIEGSEQALFSTSTSAIDRFPVIIMEPHDWMFPGQLVSREFFRFHVDSGREFAMKHENVASLALNRSRNGNGNGSAAT